MENQVNLAQLMRLRAAFDEASGEGGDISVEVFTEKLGPLLGEGVEKAELMQLFMKIDADCGGTIDWDEFTGYLLQQGKADSIDVQGAPEFVPEACGGFAAASSHHGPVERVYSHSALQRVFTCGRDGTLRAWAGHKLAPSKSATNGKAWVVDLVYLPRSKHLVCCSLDRALSFYDVHRGSNVELVGRLMAHDSLGSPNCLCEPPDRAAVATSLVFGDTSGAVVFLHDSPPTLPARGMLDSADRKDFHILHRGHRDWVTQVSVTPVGVISSSLDGTILIADPTSGRILHRIGVHSQGVSCFAWSSKLACGISAGLQREVFMWQPLSSVPFAVLQGHSASITHLQLDEKQSQVMTMAADKVIKVWDIKAQRCIQTIEARHFPDSYDSKPSAIWYDCSSQQLLTAASRPVSWTQATGSAAVMGHSAPIVAALSNATFDLVVSCDSRGLMCMWDPLTGQRRARWPNLHGDHPLTAAVFDSRQRRLVTASDDGCVKLWNFNSGALLRQFLLKGPPVTLTCLLFAAADQEDGGSDLVLAAGWAPHKVWVWEDQDASKVGLSKSLSGHKQDILCMCEWQSRILATADNSGTVLIWDLPQGDLKAVLSTANSETDHPAAVVAAMFLPGSEPNNPLLLLATDLGEQQVWEVCSSSDKPIHSWRLPFRKASIRALCCSQEGDLVAAGRSDGWCTIWRSAGSDSPNASDMAQRYFSQGVSWRVAREGVTSLAFCNKSSCLMVGLRSGGLHLWSTDGRLVGRFGAELWSISNSDTWQHAQAAAMEGGGSGVELDEDVSSMGEEDADNLSHDMPGATATGQTQPVDLFGQSQKLRDALPKTHAKLHGAFSTLRLHTPAVTEAPKT